MSYLIEIHSVGESGADSSGGGDDDDDDNNNNKY
jgi:hypothetical protein